MWSGYQLASLLGFNWGLSAPSREGAPGNSSYLRSSSREFLYPGVSEGPLCVSEG